MDSSFSQLIKSADPEKLKRLFFSTQIFLGALILGGLWFLSRKRSESNFKVRESDFKKAKPAGAKGPDLLASAKMSQAQKNEAPFRLAGIRIDGAPHEVLGVSPQATESEIQNAYRELMKQYHPDKVGRPSSREWNDAQKIAEAINRARKAMIESRQSQSPKRSGR